MFGSGVAKQTGLMIPINLCLNRSGCSPGKDTRKSFVLHVICGVEYLEAAFESVEEHSVFLLAKVF